MIWKKKIVENGREGRELWGRGVIQDMKVLTWLKQSMLSMRVQKELAREAVIPEHM